jgi:hypothetical protein
MKKYYPELKEKLEELHFIVLKRGISGEAKCQVDEEFRALRKEINEKVNSESLVPHEMRNRVRDLFSMILASTSEDAEQTSQMESVSRKLAEMTCLDSKQTKWMRSGALANTNVSLGDGLGFICGEPSNPHRECIR